jgi:hypothetical protein
VITLQPQRDVQDVVFGPYESRRLGRSLGINPLPTGSRLCTSTASIVNARGGHGRFNGSCVLTVTNVTPVNVDISLVQVSEKAIEYRINNVPMANPTPVKAGIGETQIWTVFSTPSSFKSSMKTANLRTQSHGATRSMCHLRRPCASSSDMTIAQDHGCFTAIFSITRKADSWAWSMLEKLRVIQCRIIPRPGEF